MEAVGKGRVLLIEDDALIADMYRMKLDAAGLAVDIAYDGEAGLRQAIAEPPDLILLDMMLPRLDGLDVLRGLRASERTRSVHVLVVSNSAGIAGLEHEARRLGIEDWIVKAKTTPTRLAALVTRILEG